MVIGRKLVSVVVPVYFNELNILHTMARLKDVATQLADYDVEFVFVDDGSKDNSLGLLLNERNLDSRVKIVKLSRNFGSMSAIQAGFYYSKGDCVGVIAADLQDPPELIVDMVHQWENGKKVVLAVRAGREESIGQKLFSNTYYYLMGKIALKGYPRGGFDFVFLDRQIVDELININEKNTNVMSLIYWLGHERFELEYTRQKRKHGVSRWTLAKKIKLFTDSFVGFSYVPIKVMSGIGLLTAFFSFVYGLYALINKFYGNIQITGWTTIIVIVTFLLGIIMVMLGVIGEYVWRILDETRRRPSYIVDELYD